MPLIESKALLNRFGELLGTSMEVDIAVAWARPGLAVDRLLEHARRARIRIAVGLSRNWTEPAVLRRLMAVENVKLRVAKPSRGMFHPKFYRFRGAQGTVCWIGSNNFTPGGFGGNTELVHEFSDGDEVGDDWFRGLWNDLDEDPEPEIARYEAHYRPPKSRGYRKKRPARRDSLPHLERVETWGEFVEALQVLDEYCHDRQFGWDVLGETYSYLHTIGVGREVVRRGNWEHFSLRDRNILLGLQRSDDTGAWGLLGDMGRATTVVSAFRPPGKPEYRSLVLEGIQNVVAAEEAGVAEAAASAIAKIRKLHGVGPAVATRILTLACPGRLVSVNGPSAAPLAVFADMGQNQKEDNLPDHLARKYGALLEKIHAREWCSAPEPVNPHEREIWRCRAALVDAFVYIPGHEP